MISRLRQAVRSLARSPGFAVTAVLTVAIAIGINAAIFSILRDAARESANAVGRPKTALPAAHPNEALRTGGSESNDANADQ